MVALALFIALFSQCVAKRPPSPRYEFSGNTDEVLLLWERQLISPGADNLAADDNTLFVHDYSLQVLAALNAQDGTSYWESRLLGVNRTYMTIHVDGQRVYTVNAGGVATAYSKENGHQLWTSRLEGGKVNLGSTVSDGSLQVFYENRFFEVSKANGSITLAQPPEGLIWIVRGLAIYRQGVGMEAVDRATGLTVWRANSQPFDIRAAPLESGNDRLLVRPQGGQAVCMLDLGNGTYSWCYDGGFESDIAIDAAESRGYLIDDAFNLIAINLATGATQAIGSFHLDRPVAPGDLPTQLTGIAANNHQIFVHFTTADQLFALSIVEEQARLIQSARHMLGASLMQAPN